MKSYFAALIAPPMISPRVVAAPDVVSSLIPLAPTLRVFPALALVFSTAFLTSPNAITLLRAVDTVTTPLVAVVVVEAICLLMAQPVSRHNAMSLSIDRFINLLRWVV